MSARGVTDMRRRDLARIHILREELRIADADYRDILWTIGRVRSAAEMDSALRQAVIRHLSARRKYAPGERRWISPRITLPAESAAMGKKVCALLSAGAREHPYADSIARRMCGVERWEFLPPDDMHRMIAALQIDQRRQTRRKRT
jgi:phage gp16-like protein